MSQKRTKQQNVTKTHTNRANCNKNAQGIFKFVVLFCYLLGNSVTFSLQICTSRIRRHIIEITKMHKIDKRGDKFASNMHQICNKFAPCRPCW